MGLKFKRFRAKLTWKTKETVPEVVCLRYNIHSEFDNAELTPIPATSTNVATRLRTSDLQKQLAASKIPVQSTTPASTNINASYVNNSIKTSEAIITNHNGIDTTAPTKSINVSPDVKATDTTDSKQNLKEVTVSKPKGILKKANPDENVIKEPEVIVKPISSQPENGNTGVEDINGKSALIFMTENHDDNDSLEINNNENTILRESKARKEQTEYMDEIKDTKRDQEPHASEVKNNTDEDFLRFGVNEDQTQVDSKAVNWRQTIEYISYNDVESSKQSETNKSNPDDFDTSTDEHEASDFKIHFVKHQDPPAKDLDSEDSSEIESEYETEMDTHYRNSTAYSSQAASIFFAGEEPEPTLRVRNKSQNEDDESSAA